MTDLIPNPANALSHQPEPAELILAWRESLQSRVAAGELAATTATTYQIGMQKLMAWRDANGATLTPHSIRAWKAELLAAGMKPGSVSTWLSGVRAFYVWAGESGRLTTNPAQHVKGATRRGTTKRHKRQALTDSEVLRVLTIPNRATAAGQRDTAILHLMVYTGARTIELQRADLADLRTESNRLVLAVHGKGHQESDDVVVIANPDAESALRDWLATRGPEAGPLFTSLSRRTKGDRLSLPSFRQMVKAVFKAAGVVGEGKTTHSLRHTAATAALRNGAPLQKVQSMLRHANVATTAIYAHELDRLEDPAESRIEYRRARGETDQ